MTRAPTWTTLPQAPADPRARAASLGFAVLMHVLLLALALSIKSPPVARPGPPGWALSLVQPDEGGGGGGGESVHMMQLPAAPPETPALPTVVPDPVLPELDVPELALDPSTLVLAPPPDSFPTIAGGTPKSSGAGAGAGPGTGTGTGSGNGSGTGSGNGAGRGPGAGGDGIRPPAPLTILIPPAATASVRGKHATVRLQVDTVGVVRDADVVVSSGDRGYDEKLRRIAMGWRFRAARDAAGRPVPYPFEVSLRF